MTETSGASTMDQDQNTAGQRPPGVDRGNLRNYERLRRSVTDRKIAGVAGGLGRHLDIDPTILRVLFVVLCFFGGAGLLLYGAAWLLVPEEGSDEGTVAMSPDTRNVVLIGAGVLAALVLLGHGWGRMGFPWPLVVVGVVVLLYLAFRDRGAAAGQRVPSAGTAEPTAEARADTMTGSMTGSGADTMTGSMTGSTAGSMAGEGTPPWLPVEQPPGPSYRPGKRGPRLFGLTLALLAIALGALGLYDASGGRVLDSAYPALALTVVGAMLLVGAFVGRAGGLVLLGLVATVALAATSAADSFSAAGFGDGERVSVAPTSASRVRDSYSVTSGRVLVDLSRLDDPQALDGRSIDVGARAGELVVVLPDGVRTQVTADVAGPGEIDLPDRSSGGIDTHLDGAYGDGPVGLTINTHLSVGHIDVRSAR